MEKENVSQFYHVRVRVRAVAKPRTSVSARLWLGLGLGLGLGLHSSIPGFGRSPGEGNGNPLQYPCLENSMDGGAWYTTVHGVADHVF